MTTVLLYVEHELAKHELTATLRELDGLPGRETGTPAAVRVLVPYRDKRAGSLMDDVAAARGASARSALADSRHDAQAARSASRRVLDHTLTALRAAGHPCQGEVVPVHDQVRDLVVEATASGAAAALVVSAPHRLQHLLHRDLEHRLREAGVAWVVHVDGVAPG